MVDQMTTTHESPGASQVKEAVSNVTDEASTQASKLTNAAKEHTGAVVSEAKQQARSVVRDAQTELQRQAEQQVHRVGDGMRAASTQLQTMADGGEPGVVTDLTRQLAGTLERVSSRISDGGLRAIGDDVRGFARRQPGLFLLGAGVVGFVITRAVRAAGGTSDTAPSGGASLSGPEASSPASPPVPDTPDRIAASGTPPTSPSEPAGSAPVPTPVP